MIDFADVIVGAFVGLLWFLGGVFVAFVLFVLVLLGSVGTALFVHLGHLTLAFFGWHL